ncbi:unnamed protein product, partial [Didymodactylos carnosus]
FESENGVGLFQMAVHEIGHALGLSHRNDHKESVMYAIYRGAQFTELALVDQRAIQDLYGRRQNEPAGEQADILLSDMPIAMEENAIHIAKKAVKKHFNDAYIVAKEIKRKFDERYGSGWHCVVGSNFASYITSKTKHHLYVKIRNQCILLFKAAD